MKPWDVPHKRSGDPAPAVDPDVVTVYNMRFCPYAQRTILTLLAKQVPFQVVNIDLKNKPEWFLQQTWGQVSVVRYKGHFIMESLINSDFIDELFPDTPLHPRDPAEKAKGRLRVEKFCKLTSPFYKIYYPGTAEQRRLSWDQLLARLGDMDAELRELGTTFFGGSRPGMADLMVWPWVERLPMLAACWPEDKVKYKVPATLRHYAAWVRAMREVAAVKEYSLTSEQLVQYWQQMRRHDRGEEYTYDFLLS